MTSETRTFAEAAALLPDDFYLKCAKHFLKAVKKDGGRAETIGELYDAVAVLMRMIAVVEGKQKLGGKE